MTTTTQYLDLDAVQIAQRFTVKLNDKVHELAEATVETFIANTRDIQALSLKSDVVDETELSIRLVKRAFPTMEEAELRRLKLSQVNALIEFARGANGEKRVEEAAAAEAVAANPPEAGQ